MDFHKAINPANLFSAKGLVAVITGGGSGIGLAIAAALHQSGAQRIYLLGRRLDVLNDAVTKLTKSPAAPLPNKVGTIVPIKCDVTSPDSIAAAVETIKLIDGVVDVLINNAGMIGPRNYEVNEADTIEGLRDIMLKDWDAWAPTMATNASSVIAVSAAFLPLLDAANRKKGWEGGKVTGHNRARLRVKKEETRVEQADTKVEMEDTDLNVKDMSAQAKAAAKTKYMGESVDDDDQRLAHIITVASISSYMRKVSAGLAYNASKAAAAHLGKILATLLAEWGIRSNIVAPGPYPSDMTSGAKTVFGPDENPAGRMGSETDIASLILFLVGKGGAYINGTVQITDGGRLGVFPSVY